DGECRSLVLTERFGARLLVPNRYDAKGLSDLLESLGSGEAVNFLRIETAEAHPQDFFDVAEGAAEEIVGFRGLKDITCASVFRLGRGHGGFVYGLRNISMSCCCPLKSLCPML